MNTPTSVRQAEREVRASQEPIVPELAAVPGIVAAMELSPQIGEHLRGLADALLVDDFPDSTLSRFEREILATAVSANNNCFFCMDSHAAHAEAVSAIEEPELESRPITEAVRDGDYSSLTSRMGRLIMVALNVANLRQDYGQESSDVQAAIEDGATAGDVKHTVAIAAAFSMYNRFVEGFRAMTPADTCAYDSRAVVIANQGYSK